MRIERLSPVQLPAATFRSPRIPLHISRNVSKFIWVYKSSFISWIANSPYVYSMEEYASKILAMRNQICSEKKWSFELLQGVDTLPGFLPWGIKKKLNNNKKKRWQKQSSAWYWIHIKTLRSFFVCFIWFWGDFCKVFVLFLTEMERSWISLSVAKHLNTLDEWSRKNRNNVISGLIAASSFTDLKDSLFWCYC